MVDHAHPKSGAALSGLVHLLRARQTDSTGSLSEQVSANVRLHWALMQCDPEQVESALGEIPDAGRLTVDDLSDQQVEGQGNLSVLEYFVSMLDLQLHARHDAERSIAHALTGAADTPSIERMRRCVDLLLAAMMKAGGTTRKKDTIRRLLSLAIRLPPSVALQPLCQLGPYWRLRREVKENLLQSCARFVEIDSAEFLLKNGYVVWKPDAFGRTAMHYACGTPDTTCNNPRVALFVQLVLQHQPSLLDAVDVTGRTPLQVACEFDQRDAVRVLLEAKANVHSSAKDNHTPLTLAIMRGNEHCLSALFKAGACCHARRMPLLDGKPFQLLRPSQMAHLRGFKRLADKLRALESPRPCQETETFHCAVCGYDLQRDRRLIGTVEPLSAQELLRQCSNPGCQGAKVMDAKAVPVTLFDLRKKQEPVRVVELPALKRCGRCGRVQYCSVSCQREHWSTHKGMCVPKI